MIASLTIGLICALAGAEDPFAPPEREVYVITIEGQDEPVYGFVDGWDKAPVKVELDTPWEAEPRYKLVIPSKATWEREWSGAREKRLKGQAREAGFERVGDKYYPIKEIEWAQKARGAAGVLDEQPEPDPTDHPNPEVSVSRPPIEPVPQPVKAPGVLQRWGMHALLILVALVLVALVTKTLLFSGGD